MECFCDSCASTYGMKLQFIYLLTIWWPPYRCQRICWGVRRPARILWWNGSDTFDSLITATELVRRHGRYVTCSCCSCCCCWRWSGLADWCGWRRARLRCRSFALLHYEVSADNTYSCHEHHLADTVRTDFSLLQESIQYANSFWQLE